MTENQIRKLSYEEQLKLANRKNKRGSYTALALLAQIVMWEDSWASIEIINEPDPFDYDPFSMED